jgi:thioesterase domain-containing protein
MPAIRPDDLRGIQQPGGLKSAGQFVVTVRSEIIPYYPREGCPNLFCFHDGHFDAISKALPEAWSVQGMRVANLDDADSGLTIEQVAEEHCRKLTTFQPEGPYALIGYSFGGLVAFEVARLLSERGLTVGLLALCDTPNSQFRSNLTPAEAATVQRAYLADRKRKYFENLKRGRVDRVAKDLFLYAHGKLRPFFWRFTQLWNRLAHKAMPVSPDLRTFAMWRAYVPKGYQGRLLLLRAQGRDAEFGDDITMGWNKVIAGGVDVRFVSCSHEQMKSARYAGEVAQQFELGVRALHAG